MKHFLKNIALWIYLKFHSLMYNISAALHITENEILKADPNNLSENEKIIQSARHRIQHLNDFKDGKVNEVYNKAYYQILRDADKFIKTSSAYKFGVVGDRYHMNYGLADHRGEVHEHLGFYDEKHKYYGKTIAEVAELELEERRVKDDEYELITIFNNKPIEVGLKDVLKNINLDDEIVKVSTKKEFVFPVKIYRENEKTLNKIEELCESIHLKKIGMEYFQLEFLIPLKFKTNEIQEDSIIFKEIIDFNNVIVIDDYGERKGFKIDKYMKRTNHLNQYDVLKFKVIEMIMHKE